MNRKCLPLRRAAGFTLVEVLVAMALFVLILGLLISGLYTGARRWDSVEARAGRSSAHQIATEVIRRLLEQSVPILLEQGQGSQIAFRGLGHEIDFVTELPAHSGGSGLNWVRLAVQRLPDGSRDLVLAYLPFHPDFAAFYLDGRGDPKSATLLKDIQDVKFSYFGSEKANAVQRWRRDWSSTQRMPSLIKMSITTEGSGAREIVAAVRARVRRPPPQFILTLTRPQ